MAKSWTQNGGFSSYGKTALTAKMELSGFDEFFAKIESLGKNIDKVCVKAVNAATPIIEKDMKQGAERHRVTGDVADNIESFNAKAQGDYIFAAVGIDLEIRRSFLTLLFVLRSKITKRKSKKSFATF